MGALPAGRRLRVVVDPGGGAASLAAPRLVEALGAEVTAIHTTADGRFPRPAEPVAENLGALGEAVRARTADVGFAQDMDGDRLAIVDETGRPIGEELTLVLAADEVLRRTKGPGGREPRHDRRRRRDGRRPRLPPSSARGWARRTSPRACASTGR